MATPETATEDFKATVLAILDENRIMSIATVRPDGWPQVTLVGYAHDDLTLYCTVGRSSQKLDNITRNPRVSLAIGHDMPRQLRGLSMSARASQVTEVEEIERLNHVIATRYPEQAVFAPREASCAILRIVPKLISIVDLTRGPGPPRLLEVFAEMRLRPVVQDHDDPGPVHRATPGDASAAGPAPGSPA